MAGGGIILFHLLNLQFKPGYYWPSGVEHRPRLNGWARYKVFTDLVTDFAKMAMTTQFYIVLNIKTSKGFESIGRFIIANNRERAYDVFMQMKGTEADEKNVLYLDFIETVDGLPLNLMMITCTLSQLAENCKIITKEIFKRLNLEETEQFT